MRIMNNTAFALVATLVLAASCTASGSGEEGGCFVENLLKRDSVLIGDHVRYGFNTAFKEGSSVAVVADKPQEPLEVLSQMRIDTLGISDSMVRVKGSMIVTSFDSGSFVLPAFAVRITSPDGKSDTLLFGDDTLNVTTVPVDTASFEINPLKRQIGYPVSAKDVFMWVACGIAVVLAVALIVFAVRRRRLRPFKVPGEPAHITALRRLDSYRGAKFWEPSRQKLFYTGVTDAVREYINARYGISAMEMTTNEIFEALRPVSLDGELTEELRSLFERADFVKFAKYVASEQENASVVPVAVRFVNETYQRDLEDKTDDSSGVSGAK